MNWRRVPSSPEHEVSDEGQVRSFRTGRPVVLRFDYDKHGYARFSVRTHGGRQAWRYVHSAVLEAFSGPRPTGMQIRHLDGNPANNHLVNLSYGTPSQNMLDQVEHGTHRNARKTRCANGHEYDEANTYRLGRRRHCRACSRERSRRYAARKGVAA